jgi:exosortase C (VPDSG-CTERM-specific)
MLQQLDHPAPGSARVVMKSTGDTLAISLIRGDTPVGTTWRSLARSERLRLRDWIGWIVVVTLVFVQPLTRLILHTIESDLLSYIPLVPIVAGYLLYVQNWPAAAPRPRSMLGTLIVGGLGVAALAAETVFGGRLSANDAIALMTLAYVCFLAAGGFLFLGAKWMAAAAFPVLFLMFMVPLPDRLVNWLETGSVLASAEVAAWFFNVTGTPLLRDGVVFGLPGIVIRVAQECSGIRSSWVLFITSLMASHLFLRSPWRRLMLVVFIIPLAIVRNGFRILVIGLLCVNVGPQMIDSVIHHRGGPIFFALSLVPLWLFLLWLRRGEQALHVPAKPAV